MRLQERVEMEHRAAATRQTQQVHTTAPLNDTSSANVTTVEIEGMDLLFQGLVTIGDLESCDSVSTNSSSSNTIISEEDDAVLRTRNTPRRRSTLNRHNIGNHLQMTLPYGPSELTVDSLRLARRIMEEKHEHNESWDHIPLESIDLQDDLDSVVLLNKEMSKGSLSLTSSNTTLSYISRKRVGNAAA
ncbi:MAG: hypothetical protein SGILL_009679 [Bacillariaceae sp.]